MVFNSLLFIIFFFFVSVIQFLPFGWRLRKGFLVLASYAFYSLWNPPFILLLFFSTILDFVLARGIAQSSVQSRRRFFLAVSIAANLGLLALFKYGDFFLENGEALLASFVPGGITLGRLGVDLPVGISFYTFQSMSYTIDVYRGKRRPHSSLLDFALYVSFFPQLVAGPIVRSDVFLSQCDRPPLFDFKRVSRGVWLVLIGLFCKTVLADGLLAPIVEKVYSSPERATALDAIAGTAAFSGQIYFDFSGYSTCAIGLALILGFRLPENFRYPFASLSFSEFWRRWHISLSTWLRDYVYISLGGNRRGLPLTYVFLFLTMLIGGFWHGASWNFVIWGGLHGCFLMIERMLGLRFVRETFNRKEYFLFALPRQLIVFAGVNIAWVFFRTETFADAMEIFRALEVWKAGAGKGILNNFEKDSILLVTILILVCNWIFRNREWSEILSGLKPAIRVLFAAGLILGLITLAPGSKAFLYFQF